MESRNFVDVSCFLLFEASGDSSEADSDQFVAVVGLENNVAAVADDDAESCSDLSDCVRVNEVKDCDFHRYYDDDDEDEEEDEVNSFDQTYCGEKMGGLTNIASGLMGPDRHPKSWVSIESSTKEEMDEMEKNRLFWETCLAS